MHTNDGLFGFCVCFHFPRSLRATEASLTFHMKNKHVAEASTQASNRILESHSLCGANRAPIAYFYVRDRLIAVAHNCCEAERMENGQSTAQTSTKHNIMRATCIPAGMSKHTTNKTTIRLKYANPCSREYVTI